jgi:serine/threonine-protein kinase
MKSITYLWLPLVCLGIALGSPARTQAAPDPLARQARDILRKHCFDCHGKDLNKLRGDLNLFDRNHLLDKERKIVVPRAPDESALIEQVEKGLMPPGKRPAVGAEERKLLREWVAAGAAPFPDAGEKPIAAAPAREDTAALASQVKEIFRTRCQECHGDTNPSVGIKVLDRDLLVTRKKKVLPGKPDDSILYRVLIASDETVMPKGQPRLSTEEIDAVRRWISLGAVAFPPDAPVPAEPDRENAFKDVLGVDYVLKKVLAHVREAQPEDRRFLRYFSINHVLTAGATPAELQLQRDSLAKAINHLTWKSALVKLQPIDPPVNTVFAIDLRELGWQQQPFQRLQSSGKAASPVNLFDLVLLEYPYAIAYEDSPTFDRLAEEFLLPSGQVRPIPYVRADWFVSTATQSPLYEDLLQLPFDLKSLETQLGVSSEANLRDGLVRRAGMTVSGVSRNNRVVERQVMDRGVGAYWKSYDFRSSKGTDNMFKDPINLRPAGGEFIFNLPNGLQGYFIADARGNRIDFAPTEIVTDKFAEDRTVRNGLACMRCHDAGIKGFTDSVRPALLRLPGKPGFDKQAALALYPEDTVLEEQVAADSARFLKAMKEVLGKEQTREPLVPVSRRFLDEPLQLKTAAGELGLAHTSGLETVFRTPHFTGLGLIPLTAQGVVRCDAWEDYYDQVVASLGLGTPVTPLDGLNRRDFPAGPPPFEVELKTSKKTNVFEPGDEAFVLVHNKSAHPLFIELIGTSARGEKVLLAASSTVVKPGETFCFPGEGKRGLTVKGGLGKEQITLFASDAAFAGGELLRGQGVSDRVVHPFFRFERKDGRLKLVGGPARLLKKTIEIETR